MDETQVPQGPGAIEERSFAIIESEVPEPRPFRGPEWLVVRRLIHTSGLVECFPGVEAREIVSSAKLGCRISLQIILQNAPLFCFDVGCRASKSKPLGEAGSEPGEIGNGCARRHGSSTAG